jgi:hypothetical protein
LHILLALDFVHHLGQSIFTAGQIYIHALDMTLIAVEPPTMNRATVHNRQSLQLTLGVSPRRVIDPELFLVV